MKFKFPLAFLLLCSFLLSCGGSDLQNIQEVDGFAVLPQAKADERAATFAGGCFWAMQECMVQLKGVNMVISGYAGGSTANPNYESVLRGNTGHAEAVQVYYDPEVISFEQLTNVFFKAHDPTQLNRQGPDVGSDYRSIAFYRNEGEYKSLLRVRKTLDSTVFKHQVVTELVLIDEFYPAEMEHQDYYKRHTWEPYIRRVSKPKVLKLQNSIPEMIKREYIE
jgi:peptide-methionine (S)-S-oxide reductase